MKQWYCVVDGRRYGPVGEDELRRWAREGRVRPSDSVWTQGMSGWAPAAGVAGIFTAPGTPPPPMRPHRGGTVLALGILGLAVCFICGIIAWVMGSNDLREMDAGRMDPAGRGMTRAGKICGIISVCVAAAGALLVIMELCLLFLALIAAVATAAWRG